MVRFSALQAVSNEWTACGPSKSKPSKQLSVEQTPCEVIRGRLQKVGNGASVSGRQVRVIHTRKPVCVEIGKVGVAARHRCRL